MAAANDLEIDPIWNRVSGRTGVPEAASAKPRTTTPRISSRSVIASAVPAACVSGRCRSSALPMASKASDSPATGELLPEKELELPRSRRRGVAAVHDVLPDHRGEVAADRARGRGDRIRGTHDGPPGVDRALAGDSGHDDGATRDELDEFVEEGFLAVL